MKSVGRLVALFHHRWAVPVLVQLHREGGCKFVTIAGRLGMNRDSLRRTLDALIAEGWVLRNPGYGHPMRPEYVLTRDGARLAPWCDRFLERLRALGSEDAARRKWPMAVILALLQGHERFSEVMTFLPGVTARALATALKTLEVGGLVTRVVIDGYPPVPRYRLTERGLALAPMLGQAPCLDGGSPDGLALE